MKKFLEGSQAVAEAVKLCKPEVISAYPITPQTHIVERLSQMVADGELKSEFINVESEFSAASVILGASATGSRAYSAMPTSRSKPSPKKKRMIFFPPTLLKESWIRHGREHSGSWLTPTGTWKPGMPCRRLKK